VLAKGERRNGRAFIPTIYAMPRGTDPPFYCLGLAGKIQPQPLPQQSRRRMAMCLRPNQKTQPINTTGIDISQSQFTGRNQTGDSSMATIEINAVKKSAYARDPLAQINGGRFSLAANTLNGG
jgi:hypothetical protein